jgi:PAS domain S-box-containing protein
VEELISGKRDLFIREKRYLRKDGGIVWGKISSSLLRRSDGTPAYTFGVVEDISDRKRSEEEVRLGHERLALAMAAAHAGTFDWDVPTHHNRWSPELERLYGLRPGEFDSTYESWASFVVREDRPVVELALKEAFHTGDFRTEFRIQRPNDGQIRWITARATVLRDNLGRPARILGINVDITERKEAEEALRRSHEDLEIQVEARTTALRSLSSHLLRAQDDERRRIARELHDSLGQYLAAIKMNLDLMSDSAPVPAATLAELRELAQQSLTETRTLSHLLHPPLLDEAGFASAASWYVGGFSQRSGVKVEFHIPAQLQRLPSRVETVLFRILQEALTNIHRHSGSTTAEIILTVAHGEVSMRIADSGRGIPPEMLARFQRNGTGSGIGLAGMRERVKELGGDLKIASSSSGTTLTVCLPTVEAGHCDAAIPERVSAA